MPPKKHLEDEIQYRYYELPSNIYVLALLGDKWKKCYGEDIHYLHFHNLLEIGYCYEGEGNLQLENRKLPFTNHMFSVIPPSLLHTTNSTPDTTSYWEYLFIDVERFLNDFYASNQRFRLWIMKSINKNALFKTAKESPKLASLICLLIEESRQKQEGYKESLKGTLLLLLIEIARTSEVVLEENLIDDSRKNLAISKALDYIAQNYTKSLKIKELSDICCMSETHFRRTFKKIMSITPTEYINQFRIHNACEMLRTTNKSIEEIAESVGFLSLSTFNRNFNSFLHITPSEWRNHPEHYKRKLLEYKISVDAGW